MDLGLKQICKIRHSLEGGLALLVEVRCKDHVLDLKFIDPLFNDQDGNFRASHNLFSIGSNEHFLESRSALRAHYDEVYVVLLAFGDDAGEGVLKLHGLDYFQAFEERKADKLLKLLVSKLHKVNDLRLGADGIHLGGVNGRDRELKHVYQIDLAACFSRYICRNLCCAFGFL